MINNLFAKPDYNQHRVIASPGVDAANLVTLVGTHSRAAIDCSGFKTVKGLVRLTGGTTPTITLIPLELARYYTAVGAIEYSFIAGTATAALSDRGTFDVTINGGYLFMRVQAVTGNPTEAQILLAGAETMPLGRKDRRK
jgi:hypothetical protein